MIHGAGDYRRTLTYLYGLQYRGIKFGLRNIRQLLIACGNPERAFPSIHIAGTNGKGSTSTFLASIMQEAGYRTGLYTSPHLVRFSERIRINGVEISEKRLVEYARQMRPFFEKSHVTFFEATTCIAFRYFADEGIEIGIIETGLGGRLDATNVLAPLVSVITNVAMDHMEYLGSTLSAIAREKAGIIKPGVPAVTASRSGDALRVMKSIAQKQGSSLFEVRKRAITRLERVRKGSAVVKIRTRRWNLPAVGLGHPGLHQVANASLAVLAADIAMKRGALDRLTPATVVRGLRNVVKNTGLEGRMQMLKHNGVQVMLDVAHNPDGMKVLADSLSLRGVFFPVVVFGMVQDKDAGAVLEELRRVAGLVIAVEPATARARKAEEILKLATERGIPAVLGGSVGRGLAKGIKQALSESRARRRLLVAGSHYVVGEALPYFRR
jgi:dihydrofolate synthase / folylpolyglutamate synthase